MHICVCSPGLKKILKVCGQVPELPDQLPLTENTQLIASVLLNKLYDDLKCDPERTNFRDICNEYIKYVPRDPPFTDVVGKTFQMETKLK